MRSASTATLTVDSSKPSIGTVSLVESSIMRGRVQVSQDKSMLRKEESQINI